LTEYSLIDHKSLRNGLLSKLTGKTDNSLYQFIRYFFVGGFAFGIDFGVLFLLTEFFGLYYLLSAGISFTLGLVVNYVLSVTWVFSYRSRQNRLTEFSLFTFIGLVGLFLNQTLIWFFTEILLIYYLFSKILTTLIVYFWNFLARKYFLFNNKNES